MKRKRPFCNAFMGCGRKRSDPSMTSAIMNGRMLNEFAGMRDLSRLRPEGKQFGFFPGYL